MFHHLLTKKQKGLFKRRTVSGERITKIIHQVNLKVLKEGSQPLGEAPVPEEGAQKEATVSTEESSKPAEQESTAQPAPEVNGEEKEAPAEETEEKEVGEVGQDMKKRAPTIPAER